jgi:hypothetical protein
VVIDAREHEVSPATIHRWKSKYGGMTLFELKRLKALEEENARLKRIVAQQALLAERKTKLREAAARRKEVNRGKKEIRLVSGAPELGWSERGAEAIAEAKI